MRWEMDESVSRSITAKQPRRAHTTITYICPAFDRNSPFRSRTLGFIVVSWGNQNGNQTNQVSEDWLPNNTAVLKLTRCVAETPRSRKTPHSGMPLSFKHQ